LIGDVLKSQRTGKVPEVDRVAIVFEQNGDIDEL
jgi:hypothetical protein